MRNVDRIYCQVRGKPLRFDTVEFEDDTEDMYIYPCETCRENKEGEL